jgi:hypothetical protein
MTSPPQAAPMAEGTWELSLEAMGRKMPGTLVLNSIAGGLSGTLALADDSVDVENASLNGDVLTWEASVKKPMKMKLKFQAVIDGDAISGSGKFTLGKIAFSGTRVSS